MAFYNTCALCGCNLDPGERCDCVREKEKKDEELSRFIKIEARGQYRLDFSRLERGANEKAAV